MTDASIPSCNLAINLQARQQKIAFLNVKLDKSLNGGIPTSQVTEIYGESGVGKTQLCLQLCANVQLPPQQGGLFGGAVYLYSKYRFPTTRLQQMISGLRRRLSTGENVSMCNVSVKIIEDHISLHNTLQSMQSMCEEALQTDRHIRVIVIDSIAPLIKTYFEENPKGYKDRANKLFRLSHLMHGLAHKFNLAVIVVNEVTDVVSTVPLGMNKPELSLGRYVLPLLGLPWSHCVNNRLFARLSKGTRTLKIVFSPHLATAESEYEIDEEGVH